MTRLRIGVLLVAGLVVAAASGGVVGAGAAIALVKTAYNGRVEGASRSELAVHSDALGEPLLLQVRLPLEYASDAERRFPVLWVLDGPSQGEHVARSTQMLSRIGVAEPSIVVEVPSSGAGRTADFTPPRGNAATDARADRFLGFLETEAIPAVADAFRTDSVRVLVGHSLGGLFTLYALVQRPALFDGYFAFSPSVWVSDQAIVPDFVGLGQSRGWPRAALYLSLGSREGNRMRSGFEAIQAALRSSATPDFRWQADITSDADHGSNPELSFPVAANWFWAR
jgi:predicted alpha/beta superfamily hydrolase